MAGGRAQGIIIPSSTGRPKGLVPPHLGQRRFDDCTAEQKIKGSSGESPGNPNRLVSLSPSHTGFQGQDEEGKP